MRQSRTVAAYVRVSTGGQNVASQKLALERAASARGERIGKWFMEKRSGASLARPELARVRELARRGELRRLYVWRLDRLTRSGIRDTLALLEELRGAGCAVVTVADGFELGGPAGDVVVAVIAWAADMERRAIGERIRAAHELAVAKGRRWGRARRLSPLELERARKLAKTHSTRELAVKLKVPRSTLRDSLARE